MTAPMLIFCKRQESQIVTDYFYCYSTAAYRQILPWRMSALGRKLPFDFADSRLIECPLLVRADVQPGATENAISDRLVNGWQWCSQVAARATKWGHKCAFRRRCLSELFEAYDADDSNADTHIARRQDNRLPASGGWGILASNSEVSRTARL